MTIRAFFDDRVREPQDGVASVFDRGFLLGDSVYETVGTNRGRPVRTILPVTQVDGVTIGDGRPGTSTRQLMSLYRQLVEAKT